MRVKDNSDRLRDVAERLPRSARFLVVGGLGLVTDIGTFTLFHGFGIPPLIARLISLSIATLVTWRLNRALTFDDSGRRQHKEAIRYAVVTAAAQGTSYAVFAVLTLTVLAALPQLAIVVGAAIGALISYNGHRLFAFARAASEPAASSTNS
jgi:putative flippase GtrA